MKSQRSKITPLMLENRKTEYSPRFHESINIKELLDSRETQDHLHISIPKWKIPPKTSSISKRIRRVPPIETKVPEFAFEFLNTQAKPSQTSPISDKSIKISVRSPNHSSDLNQSQTKHKRALSKRNKQPSLRLTPQARKAFYSTSPTKYIARKPFSKSPRYSKIRSITDNLAKCPLNNMFIDFTQLSFATPAVSFGEKLRRIQMIIDNAHSIFN